MPANQDEIHKKSQSENEDERIEALEYIESNFESLSEKSILWDDLHRLTNDNNSYVRSDAVYILVDIFSSIPDEYKNAAMSDLHKYATDKKYHIRYEATEFLGYYFSDIDDKNAAWDDLHKLTMDKKSEVRKNAVGAFRFAFWK